MKKQIKIIFIMLLVLSTLTGCTKYMQDGNKTRIKSEITGQTLTSNILCLPEDDNLYKLYSENKEYMDVDFDSLEKCTEYSPSDLKYKSLWESLFIKPLAWLIIKIGMVAKNYGLAVIILGILIRILLVPLTKKTLLQSENMKKVQPELAKIREKYSNAQNDQTQAILMSQEMMSLYKKYNINPASGCIVSFIQLPLLLGFLEAINRVPAIFEGSFLSLQLGTSPMIGISQGNFGYIIIVLLIMLSTYGSYKISMNTQTGNPEQDKQMAMMMKFMIIFISFASLSLPTALALYWIISNLFMLFQNIYIKKFVLNKENKMKNETKNNSKKNLPNKSKIKEAKYKEKK